LPRHRQHRIETGWRAGSVQDARRSSETHRDPKDRTGLATYYITVAGQAPKAFDMNFKKPNITVKQGTVEDWVVENRANEAHAFQIHQLHFLGDGARRQGD
jgi:FtsP/CotA-like multicopper oxidase with cupredoxin domain